MRSVIVFTISLVVCIFSFKYVDDKLTKSGEYHASLYIINKNDVSHVRIITHMEGNEFVTRSYLTSPGLSKPVTFLSKGEFIDDDSSGKYHYAYKMKVIDNANLIDPQRADLYMSMVGRLGLPINESITMLFHDKEISIFDMMRNKSVIMYSKHN